MAAGGEMRKLGTAPAVDLNLEKNHGAWLPSNNDIRLVEISHIYKVVKDRIKQNPVVIILLVGCQSEMDHFNISNKKNVLNYALLCFAISLWDIYA